VIYIKTKKEIDFIRESCKIVAETLKLVANNVRPGVATIELDRIAEEYILSNNAKAAFKGYSQAGSYDYPASICVSIDNEVVHGIPNERILKEGQIVSIDVGVLKKGYYGDAAISVAVGELSSEKKRLLDVTEKSLYEGIREARLSNRVHDISSAIQNYVEANGFSVVKDLCGHGVGKYLHEEPAVPNYGTRGTGPKLKKGMTIAIEPMVNAGTYKVKTAKDGWTVVTEDSLPSAHFEHTVLISNGSPEILTVC
jgi:methionyl aminopeptidase